MEQTPIDHRQPRRQPGEAARASCGCGRWQAVAHGADAVLFFQMRQSRGACEKYHGAVLDHAGRTDTRVFREVAALGARAGERSATRRSAPGRPRGSRCCSTGTRWWALEMSDGPNRHVRYLDVLTGLPPRAVGRRSRSSTSSRSPPTSTGTTSSSRPLLHLVKGDLPSRLRGAGRARRHGADHVPVRPGRRGRQRVPHGRARPAAGPAGRAGRRDRRAAARRWSTR